jgi:hypothetical protein
MQNCDAAHLLNQMTVVAPQTKAAKRAKKGVPC